MSSTSIPVYTCDRCGTTEEIRQNHQIYDWGTLIARQNNGPFSIGAEKCKDGAIKGADLCPTCTGTLKSWWMIGRNASGDSHD